MNRRIFRSQPPRRSLTALWVLLATASGADIAMAQDGWRPLFNDKV